MGRSKGSRNIFSGFRGDNVEEDKSVQKVPLSGISVDKSIVGGIAGGGTLPYVDGVEEVDMSELFTQMQKDLDKGLNSIKDLRVEVSSKLKQIEQALASLDSSDIPEKKSIEKVIDMIYMCKEKHTTKGNSADLNPLCITCRHLTVPYLKKGKNNTFVRVNQPDLVEN